MVNYIKEFFSFFWNQAVSILKWLLYNLFNLLIDIFYIPFDFVLSTFETLITSINFLELKTLNTFAKWNLIPDQVLYVLDRMNLGYCLTMLLMAYTIRLILNLIPAAFTRV